MSDEARASRNAALLALAAFLVYVGNAAFGFQEKGAGLAPKLRYLFIAGTSFLLFFVPAVVSSVRGASLLGSEPRVRVWLFPIWAVLVPITILWFYRFASILQRLTA